ncbi:MAG TPA: HYR domain-containing protein [Blastocatellia bacterium]|nr:HYR domain-containing protein [Blastocatellia bacterium]
MLNGAESINLNSSGNLGVALLGGAAFDVKSVDPASLSFAGASAMKVKGTDVPPSSASSSDKGGKRPPTFNIAYKDVNKDGYADLVAYFPIRGLSQLSAGTREAFLRARTYGGAAITGSQFVQATGDRQKKAPKGDGTCNGGTITINDDDAATPYPSAINVTGQTGVISNLTVSIFNFNHDFAQDVSVLLVGPTGQKMILFSMVGASFTAAENVNLTFDDAATAYLPIDTAIASGTYKPTNRAGQDLFGDVDFFAPAPQATPASPYYATLSSFLGTDPNGTWSLYVVDNAEGDSGSIDSGWCLDITTAPSVTTCAATLLQGSFVAGDTTQTGRLFRDGIPSECVGTAKTCPGDNPDSSKDTLHYDTYTLTNQNTSPVCVTVTTTSSCGFDVFTSAYLTSYTPPPPGTNLCTNYLGDEGLSPQDNGLNQSFSVTVPAGATLVLVANEVDPMDPLCEEYSLLVEGNICPVVTGSCTLTCPANITTSNDPNQCGAVVNYPAPTTTGSCGTVTCSPASGSFFPKGTTTVTCTATGGGDLLAPAGGGPSCSFTVTVNDTQPPTITCPMNVTAVTAQTCPPSSTAIVTYPPPIASDNCPGVVTACTPPSGSTFPLGASTVTCTATDTSGNTATCSFTVTTFSGCLQDDANPAIVVLFNTATGEYRFCCNGTIFTGKGTVKQQGCVIQIEHNPADRRVLIRADFAAHSGTASLQVPAGKTICTITDRNTSNNTCQCGSTPPTKSPTK